MASQHQRQPWQNQPWARDFQSMFGGPASDQHMRVSDAERQAVADRLAEHFSSGRLDQEEFDERVSRAMSAKTRADLNGLFDDLPESGRPAQGLPETGAPAGVCAQQRRFRQVAGQFLPGDPCLFTSLQLDSRARGTETFRFDQVALVAELQQRLRGRLD